MKLKEVKGESCKIEWCREKWTHVERWESEERRNGVTWPRPHACLSSLVFYVALYLTLLEVRLVLPVLLYPGPKYT